MTEINQIKKLIEEYGGRETTLGSVLDNLLKLTPYKCPCCNGEGTTRHTYNAYPTGLPDSGYVYQEGVKYKTCKLCKGVGYTEEEFIPKMIQDGWEVSK